MSKNPNANPDPETEVDPEPAGSPAAAQRGKRSVDELPDGSGNDAKKSYEPDNTDRYDAG